MPWTDTKTGKRITGDVAFAVATFQGGFRYEGGFKGGEPHGRGKMLYPSGNRYEGEFANGNREGEGTMFYLADGPNKGDRYEGQWKNDKPEGAGTYFFADGRRYEGALKNDQFHGFGTMFYPDGRRWAGQWDNTQVESEGTWFDAPPAPVSGSASSAGKDESEGNASPSPTAAGTASSSASSSTLSSLADGSFAEGKTDASLAALPVASPLSPKAEVLEWLLAAEVPPDQAPAVASALVDEGFATVALLQKLDAETLKEITAIKLLPRKLILAAVASASSSSSGPNVSSSSVESAQGSISPSDDNEPSAGLARMSDVAGEDGGLRNPLAGKFAGRELLSFDDSVQIASTVCASGIQQCLPTSLAKARQLESEFPQLSLDQIRSVVLYTMEAHPRESSFYFAANAALRSRKREDAEPFLDLVHLCLTALRLLPTAKSSVVVRGMREAYEGLGPNYAKGSQFQLSGFTSTAERVEVMETFVGQTGPRTLLQLQLTQGDARDIRRFSLFPDESEVLLPPNTMFEVESVFSAGGGMTLVQCRQIAAVDALLEF
jgi:hypothetical protein